MFSVLWFKNNLQKQTNDKGPVDVKNEKKKIC